MTFAKLELHRQHAGEIETLFLGMSAMGGFQTVRLWRGWGFSGPSISGERAGKVDMTTDYDLWSPPMHCGHIMKDEYGYGAERE